MRSTSSSICSRLRCSIRSCWDEKPLGQDWERQECPCLLKKRSRIERLQKNSHTVGFPAIDVRDRWRGCGRINLDNFIAFFVVLLSTGSTFRHVLGLRIQAGALASFAFPDIGFPPFSTTIIPGSFLSLANAFGELMFQLFERFRYGIPDTRVGVKSRW